MHAMILIVVKFKVRPDRRDEWLAVTEEFTRATRAEPGNRRFEWFNHTENPDEFVLIEEFEGREAGDEHVRTEHFKTAMDRIPDTIAETPKIIHLDLEGEGWSELAELAKKPGS
jgi:quinol monooxygenase YgiN